MCHLCALAWIWHVWKRFCILVYDTFVLCKMIIIRNFFHLEQDQKKTHTTMWSKIHQEKTWINLPLHTDVPNTITIWFIKIKKYLLKIISSIFLAYNTNSNSLLWSLSDLDWFKYPISWSCSQINIYTLFNWVTWIETSWNKPW